MQDLNRYVLYIQDENKEIIDFIGPLLDEEIPITLVEYFYNRKDVEILQESIFKMLYKHEYIIDFKNNWIDYVICLLDSLHYKADILEVKENEDDEVKEIIVIYDVGIICQIDDSLIIQLFDNTSMFFAADCVLNITKYCFDVFDVNIEEIQNIPMLDNLKNKNLN